MKRASGIECRRTTPPLRRRKKMHILLYQDRTHSHRCFAHEHDKRTGIHAIFHSSNITLFKHKCSQHFPTTTVSNNNLESKNINNLSTKTKIYKNKNKTKQQSNETKLTLRGLLRNFPLIFARRQFASFHDSHFVIVMNSVAKG